MALLKAIIGFAGVFLTGLGSILVTLWYETPAWAWAVLILGVLLLAVFLAGQKRSLKALAGSPKGRQGARAGFLVITALGLAFFTLLVSHRYHLRMDLTADMTHSLSPQSLQILENLAEEVTALAFFQEGDPAAGKARDLLTQYAYNSAYFRFEMLDPDRYPTKAQQHRVKTYGVVVLKSPSGTRTVSLPEETALTSALIALTKAKKTVYFVTGHGEHPLDESGPDSYAQAVLSLEEQNYRVEPLLLMESQAPPPNSVLVIAGPKTRFAPQEIRSLAGFIKKSGRLMLLLDPGTTAGLEAVLSGLGIDFGPNVIIDKRSRMMGTEPTVPVVSEYRDHPITKGFKLASFFPLARGFRIADARPENIALTPIALTGSQAWGETDLKRLHQGQAERDDKDWPGPVPVALAVEEVLEAKKGKESAHGFKMLLFGDSDFAANAQFNLAGHRDLFLNSAAWLAENEELISIRPRTGGNSPAFLSVTAAKVVFWLPVVIIPGIIALIGAAVLGVRRRRS